ncbi:MAG: hypothetical protein WAY93_06105 [Atopobiaceae bacterium]|jgi:hypothetical protein|nr:hypothetical protein [Atopobiaceae bacterium]
MSVIASDSGTAEAVAQGIRGQLSADTCDVAGENDTSGGRAHDVVRDDVGSALSSWSTLMNSAASSVTAVAGEFEAEDGTLAAALGWMG